MNVYDFDNTIYSGESSLDFFLFCLGRDIRLLRFVFPVMKTLIQYKMTKISTEELSERAQKYMISFIRCLPDRHQAAERFWESHEKKIKKFYLSKMRPDDVIISASPEEFLAVICKRLGISNLIATTADYETGEVLRVCHGEEKVRLFFERFPQGVIDEFYSDSKSDLPLARIAKKAYFVRGKRITEWNR